MPGLTEIKTKTQTAPSTSRISANLNNVLNVLGYAINITTTYLGGVAGWFGGSSNAELSSKYQTLITPAASFFGYIWGLIFLFQGFFAAAQVLPQYRNHPMVQDGISIMYFIVCSAQAAWTILFGYELMIPAFASIVVVLISLLAILRMQWNVAWDIERRMRKEDFSAIAQDNSTIHTDNNTTMNDGNANRPSNNDTDTNGEIEYEFLMAEPPRLPYWLLRFPFSLHAGWITPATSLMLSVLLVSLEVSIEIELWAAVLGVAMIFGLSMGLLLRQDSGAPVYSFPGTVAYASFGIMWELMAPSDDILGRHDEASINLVKNVAGFSGVCLIVTMVSRFVALFLRDRMCRRKDGEEEESEYEDGNVVEIGYVQV
mmetsp:Transcript_25917/g.52708  ORF Transcript_25917/g.52708 Transcript_25917/m.52708 type:complete len:372 (-) Transcript_25917:168-1283(-)